MNVKPDTSIPIGIQDWMDASHSFGLSVSNQTYYLESATNLALLLTGHLRKLGPDVTEAKLAEMNTENVLLFVDTKTKLDIRAVKFRFEAPDMLPLLSILSREGINYIETTTTPPAPCTDKDADSAQLCRGIRQVSFGDHTLVCNALGKILLDIFSMGQLGGNIEDTSSSKAKDLLLELGMPLSIRQLIGDLLDAANNPCPKSALTSLDEAEWDLSQMKSIPGYFLFDQTYPQALEATGLFGGPNSNHLFGREKEMKLLLDAKKKIANHVQSGCISNTGKESMCVDNSFACDAMFLSGCAGIGKSSLLRELINSCQEQNWFILHCKFDKAVAPHQVLAKAFDDFFAQWYEFKDDLDSAMMQLFQKICHSIFAKLDSEGFAHLCALGKIFLPWYFPAFTNHLPFSLHMY